MLIVLLGVIGLTLLRMGQLLSVHLFVGVMLLGPVGLKLCTTGYRFARYYTANERYRRKGPPLLPLRLIAPVVVLSTIVVFATGVALLLIGPSSRGSLLEIHKISFFVWVAFMAIHVLAHLPTALRALRADYGSSASRETSELWGSRGAGRAGRAISLASAIVLGLVLAILALPEFGAWLHGGSFHH